MNIRRVDFLGFTVAGPRSGVRSGYKPSEWPGWTARAEGNAVLFEGEGRRVEVPRSRCTIDWEMAEAKVTLSRETLEAAAQDAQNQPSVFKRRGRPPKAEPPTEPQAA